MNEPASNPPQGATSVTSEPVAADVAAIMQRVRRADAQWERENARQGPDRDKVMSWMRSGGYPARAMDKVDAMHGPGLAKAEELLPMASSGDSILVLYGDRGPGKTQMATWWAYQRGLRGRGVGRYIKTFDLLAALKATWGAKGGPTEADILKGYSRAKFLVLDEFQERGEGDWENRTLTNLVDHRYDNRLPTIIIGNFDREAMTKIVPASILSRAEEGGGRVFCDWPSYRGAR